MAEVVWGAGSQRDCAVVSKMCPIVKRPGGAPTRRGLDTGNEVPMPDETLPQEKTCTKCGKAKALDKFSPHKFTRDGRTSQCKACSNAEQKARAALRIRQCERCKRRKQSTYFPPHSRECSDCAPPQGFKRCGKCGLTKPLGEFYEDSRGGRHGRGSRCKPCVSLAVKYWAEANPARRKEIEDRWRDANPERKRELARRWSAENAEAVRRSHERSLERFPERRQARVALGHAVESGRIVKPACCEECGAPTESRLLHAHHEDYSKPLEVEWLCVGCHTARHRD